MSNNLTINKIKYCALKVNIIYLWYFGDYIIQSSDISIPITNAIFIS